MTDLTQITTVADALDHLLDVRAGLVPLSDMPNLSPEDRAEAEALVGVADLLWESAQTAPPLDRDPVAKMLGLVE